MPFTFHGVLCGYICPHCPERLPDLAVRIYRMHDDQNVVALATAPVKETLTLLSDDDAQAKHECLLAEARTDENGAFTVELGGDYDGEAFEIDVSVAGVPGGRETDTAPLQFTVTTVQPKWRDAENGLVATWEYCFPARVWCNVRARFDAWVICGTVVDCDTKVPVAGVNVTAFDTDLTQDDTLGTGTTDATGRFRIDYATNDFRRTPISWINFEWVGGPDVYFSVETTTGTMLLQEPRSRGRTPGRENAGHCLCVELCLDEPPPPTEPQTVPLFTHVGTYKVDSVPADSDFTAAGTTKSGDFAFTRTIPLIGLLPDGTAIDPVEYRFRYRELPAGPLVDADATKLTTTKIGQLEYWAWNGLLSVWQVKAADFWAGAGGSPQVSIPQPVGPPVVVQLNTPIKAGGWVEVPTIDDLTFGGAGRFVPNGGLASLDTTELSEESFDLTVVAPPLPLSAGDSVPAAQRASKPTFQVMFEARKVAGGAAVNSNSLDVIAVSNTTYTYTRHPYWAGGNVATIGVVSLGIAEMVPPGGTGCDKLTTTMHALWTVYHPYMGSTRVWFEGNSPLPADLNPAIDVAGQSAQGVPGHLFDISGMAPCAYILWLSGTLDLTRGWGRITDATIWDKIAFCVS